jgi:effector-binding domain-containing protein
MVKWILIFLAVIVAGIAAFLSAMGFFNTLKVSQQIIGPYTLAYKEHKGPYQKIGPVFNEVNNILGKELNVQSSLGIGLYYDNPRTVAADMLRSEAAYVITETDPAKLDSIRAKLAVKDYPTTLCLTAEFPYKNMTSMFLGVIKAYPALMKYAKDNGINIGSPSLEIYDMSGGKITFAFPIKS